MSAQHEIPGSESSQQESPKTSGERTPDQSNTAEKPLGRELSYLDAAPPSRRAPQFDPSLFNRRAGRICNDWSVREWDARGDVHQNGQGRLNRLWSHGFIRNRDLAGSAIWCSAEDPVRQVQPHPI